MPSLLIPRRPLLPFDPYIVVVPCAVCLFALLLRVVCVSCVCCFFLCVAVVCPLVCVVVLCLSPSCFECVFSLWDRCACRSSCALGFVVVCGYIAICARPVRRRCCSVCSRLARCLPSLSSPPFLSVCVCCGFVCSLRLLGVPFCLSFSAALCAVAVPLGRRSLSGRFEH